MKLKSKIAAGAIAAAMLIPGVASATSITPDGFLNLHVDSTGLSAQSISGFLDSNGYAAWGFELDGDAGSVLSAAFSIKVGNSYYPLKASIVKDTTNVGQWDVGSDLTIVDSGVNYISGPIYMTAHNLVAGTKYFLALQGDLSANAGGKNYAGEVSAVPLPAAAWLFGSALLGFMGWSNRRKV